MTKNRTLTTTVFFLLFSVLSSCAMLGLSYVDDTPDLVTPESDKDSYVFKKGDEVIGTYHKAFPFGEWLQHASALVQEVPYGSFYFIDVNGKPIDNKSYDFIYRSHYGYCLRDRATKEYNIYQGHNKIADEGALTHLTGDLYYIPSGQGKYLVNKDASPVHLKLYHRIFSFSKNILAVADIKKIDDDKTIHYLWHLIYHNGKRVDHFEYREIKKPVNGMAIIKYNHDAYGFVNEEGKMLNPKKDLYKEVKNFIGDVGFVKIDDEWQTIDKQGGIGSDRYAAVHKFSNGFVVVRDDEGHHYMNPKGHIVNAAPFVWASEFRKSSNGEKYAIVKKTEKEFFTILRSDLTEVPLNLYPTHPMFNKHGLSEEFNSYEDRFIINTKGKRFGNQYFDRIYFMGDTINFKYNGVFQVYNLKGKLIHSGSHIPYEFFKGIACVTHDKSRYYFIYKNGKLLNDETYDDEANFQKGNPTVKQRGKKYILNTEGKHIREVF